MSQQYRYRKQISTVRKNFYDGMQFWSQMKTRNQCISRQKVYFLREKNVIRFFVEHVFVAFSNSTDNRNSV